MSEPGRTSGASEDWLENADGRDALELLADDYASRLRNGERPSFDEYIDRYPSLSSLIEELFPTLELIEMSKSSRGSSPSLPPGVEQMGEYRIIREIGRGGMGVVYLAVQESLDRRVALKVLFRQSLLDQRKLERFKREARAAGLLHHSNIVPVFGVGEHEGIPYFAMQYIDGVSLRVLLDGLRKAVSLGKVELGGRHWRFVARIGVQAAQALHHAHLHGILHRDVKPSNLLLDRDQVVWVADFGLAKLTDHDELTETGDIVGTIRYLAPECLERGGDARSDVYSLGLTLYELLILESPFPSSRPTALCARQGKGRSSGRGSSTRRYRWTSRRSF